MSVGQKVKVQFDFDGDKDAGELCVLEGDILTITNTEIGDGWWEGTTNSGERGLFPISYVEVVPEAKKLPPVLTLPPRPSLPPPPRDDDDADADADDWSDSWDEDSVEGGSMAGDMDRQYASLKVDSTNTRDRVDSISRTGTIRKSMNRFSTFVKSGGEAYLLGSIASDVPSVKQVTVQEAGDGTISWEPSSNPFTCTITNPEKKSKFKGVKSFISYKIENSLSHVTVSRRFKHFDWLHERLQTKYTLISVPPLPDKQYAGRFEENFIEVRRNKLQMWLNRICQHPVLSSSEVFQHFLRCQDDKDWKAGKRRAESDKLVGAGFFLSVSVPKAFSHRMSPQAVETKVDQFSAFVKKMDDSVINLSNKAQYHAEKCTRSYRNEYKKLGNAFTDLSNAFALENDKYALPLTNAICQTARTYDEIGDLYGEQPVKDLVPLMTGLKEYSELLSTFPDIIHVQKGALARVKECQKLNAEEKMSFDDIEAVNTRADTISCVTLAETRHFHDERIKDYKKLMQAFLNEQIKFHQQIVQKLQDAVQVYENAYEAV